MVEVLSKEEVKERDSMATVAKKPETQEKELTLNQDENFIRHLFVRVEKHQELPTKLYNEKK